MEALESDINKKLMHIYESIGAVVHNLNQPVFMDSLSMVNFSLMLEENFGVYIDAKASMQIVNATPVQEVQIIKELLKK